MAEFSSFANVSVLVYASFISLHVFAHFGQLLPSPCPRPAALLCNCSQVLADQLRLNRILTSLQLARQNICDEKVKAPAGPTAASWAEGAGVGRGTTEFSWGARCLTMPQSTLNIFKQSLTIFEDHYPLWNPIHFPDGV